MQNSQQVYLICAVNIPHPDVMFSRLTYTVDVATSNENSYIRSYTINMKTMRSCILVHSVSLQSCSYSCFDCKITQSPQNGISSPGIPKI